ncbi:MAG: hypothetical protein ACI8Y7_000502 [Candidatus Woesearchaeota archaeon]|jgi:hypothetical protein
MKRAQNWSIEVIIALSFFLVLFVGVATFITVGENPTEQITDVQAESFVGKFTAKESTKGQTVTFVEKNKVNEEKLTELTAISYEELKELLDIDDDFCIVIEDQFGDTILIDGDHRGIGSENIMINGFSCG